MNRGVLQAYRKALTDPLVETNPITLQVLGLCSALAVTGSVLPAVVMSLAVICVLVFANVCVSLLRHVMPQSIRLIIEMTLIASAVIVVDEFLKAFMPDIARVLSVFVGLIITNCIVLARVESFAMHRGVLESLLDGLGNGLGYTWVLLLIASVREVLGSGTWAGYRVLETVPMNGVYVPNQFFLLTPSAFFLLALLVWALRSGKPSLPQNAPATGHAVKDRQP